MTCPGKRYGHHVITSLRKSWIKPLWTTMDSFYNTFMIQKRDRNLSGFSQNRLICVGFGPILG